MKTCLLKVEHDLITKEGKNMKDVNPLVTSGMSKTYGNFKAVDTVSFHVEPNQCFGLLGPNGAGKTSLFKMLTGEHDITSGSAFINSFDVQTERFESLREFGYCPQVKNISN